MPARRPDRSLAVVYEPRDMVRQLWLTILRVVNRQTRALDLALAEVDLTMAQFDLLATLSVEQGITQQQLAERLLVTKGNICGLLDRMATQKLITRRPDPKDGRLNRVSLSKHGTEQLKLAMPIVQRTMNAAFSHLSHAEQQEMLRLIGSIESQEKR